MSQHHEVPTHLNVEDKVLCGLTVRQFLYMLVGSSASYTLWEQAAVLGDAGRAASVLVSVGVTLAFALLRPGDRPLEEWLAVALVFAASPRHTTWQPAEPVAGDWLPQADAWQDLAPNAVWAVDQADADLKACR